MDIDNEIRHAWNDYKFWANAFDEEPKSINLDNLNPTNDFREGFMAGMEYKLREDQKK